MRMSGLYSKISFFFLQFHNAPFFRKIKKTDTNAYKIYFSVGNITETKAAQKNTLKLTNLLIKTIRCRSLKRTVDRAYSYRAYDRNIIRSILHSALVKLRYKTLFFTFILSRIAGVAA